MSNNSNSGYALHPRARENTYEKNLSRLVPCRLFFFVVLVVVLENLNSPPGD